MEAYRAWRQAFLCVKQIDEAFAGEVKKAEEERQAELRRLVQAGSGCGEHSPRGDFVAEYRARITRRPMSYGVNFPSMYQRIADYSPRF